MLLGLYNNLSLTQIFSGERFLGKSGLFGGAFDMYNWINLRKKQVFPKELFLKYETFHFFIQKILESGKNDFWLGRYGF